MIPTYLVCLPRYPVRHKFYLYHLNPPRKDLKFPNLLSHWFYRSNFIRRIWKARDHYFRDRIIYCKFNVIPSPSLFLIKKTKAYPEIDFHRLEEIYSMFVNFLARALLASSSSVTWTDLDCKTLFRKREFMGIVGKLVSLLVFKTVCYITDIRSILFYFPFSSLQRGQHCDYRDFWNFSS